MSARRPNRSPDIQRLVDDGYDLAIVDGFLVLRDVPYVDRHRQVRRGQLVSTLDLAGDRTVRPRDHQAWFAGALPCDREGRPLVNMVHAERRRDLGRGLVVDHWLCSKPFGREFYDYHEKMVTFVHQIASHAAALDPTATARTGRIVAADATESPFHYADTATARNGTGRLTDRIAGQAIGIVGLGGTGGYVLDFLSKTPVARIHLFDDDLFLQHNAFRAPGAAPLSALTARRAKVDHFDRIYSALHRGIVPHRVRMSAATMPLTDGLDFVFLCLDEPTIKRSLIARLEDQGTSFIDLGMGLQAGEAGLTGVLRVTTSTPAMRDHVWDRSRIPMAADDRADPYATNVQIAELNALNAALAVVRWKRICGFYADTEAEHFSTYAVDGNHMINDDRA